MILARREMMAGGALAVVAAAIGAPIAQGAGPDLIPAGRDALILHAGDRATVDFLHHAGRDARISDTAIAVLGPQGFARTGALLDRARGKLVIAWLDDGDALVVEAMLIARGATGLARRRWRDRALLTASL